jgi:molybdate transport system substrate-binding protein
MTLRRTFVLAFALALFSSLAGAQAIRVLASNGMKAAVDDLKPAAEKAIGKPITIEFGSTTMLKPKLESGEGYDVAIVTSEVIDDLIKAGKISSDTRVKLARCGIGVGIRAGAVKPDIKTGEALKRALLNVKAVSYAQDGASRTSVEKMFAKMGIAEQMNAKTVLEQGSVRSAGRVVSGDADFVLTLVSEILPIKGIELLGPLPAEYQGYVSFSAGVATKAANPGAAASFVKSLVVPVNAAVYKAKGMEPL